MFRFTSLKNLVFFLFALVSIPAFAYNGVIDGTNLSVDRIVLENSSTDLIFEDDTEVTGFDRNEGDGGAVYAITLFNVANNVKFNLNISDGNGGAVYSEQYLVIGNEVLFESNEAVNGGALYNKGTVTIAEKASFKTNIASGDGGAFYNEAGSITFGTEALFESNEAVNGAGVYNKGSVTIADKASFKTNIATGDGGAIYNYEGGSISIGKESTFDGNEGVNGGAIYSKGRLDIDSSGTFKNNIASGNGGAIYLEGTNSFSLMSGTFEANEAVNGGAFYNNGATTSIGNGVLFKGNIASGDGAAIYNESGTVTIYSGTQFEGNQANGGAGKGGAIYTKGTVNLYVGMASIKFITEDDDIYVDGGTLTSVGTGRIDASLADLTVTNSGTLDIGASNFTLDTVNFYDNTTLKVTISKSGGNVIHGTLTANTIAVSGTGTKLQFTIDRSSLEKFVPYELSVISDGTNDFNEIATNDNNLYEIEKLVDGKYKITRKDISTEQLVQTNGADQNILNTAKAWNDGADFTLGSKSDDVAAKLYALAQSDVDAYMDALALISPNAGAMVYEMTTEKISQMFRITSNRLGSSYAQDKKFGEHYEGFWMEGIYNHAKYNQSKNNKFDNDSAGFVLGYDGDVNHDLRMGVAYSYVGTDSEALPRASNINSNSFMVYGQYTMSDNWYIDGILSYVYSTFDETKDVFGTLVTSESDLETVAAQVSSGYIFDLGFVNLVPEFGLRTVTVYQGEYKDALGQEVKGNVFGTVTGLADLSLNKIYEFSSGYKLRWELRFGAGYDLLASDAEYKIGLPNGSEYEIMAAHFDELSYGVGANVTLYTSGKLRITFGYDGKMRKDYENHMASVVLSFKF